MSTDTAAPRATSADRAYGIIGAALAVLALFFLLRGGPADGDAPAPGAAPPLALVEPRDGVEAALPLAVVFDAGTRLELGPMGWHAGGRHVHLLSGDTELMAAPGDLTPLGRNRYRWTVPSLPAGEQTLRLTWSDDSHRPLAEGASPPVRVRVRAAR